MIFNMTTGTTKTPVLNTSYPANATVVCGTSATFKVEISEAGIPATYTYQWYVNDTAVSGATSPSYTRDTSSDKGTYSVYCKVTNIAGTVVSRTATLTVNKTPVLNSSYPANASVTVGKSTTLEVAIATDGYPTSYTYQWYKNGTEISGATSSTYIFTPTATGETTFYCKVTNTAGTVTSRTATITAPTLTLVSTDFGKGWDAYWRGYGSFMSDGSATTTMCSNQKYDLTYYKTITFTAYKESYAKIQVCASTATTYSSDTVATYVEVNGDLTTSEKTFTLDISGLTGEYYILLYVLGSLYGQGGYVYVTSMVLS